MISKDEFEMWLDNEVTETVFKVFSHLQKRAKEEWVTASWEYGECDPVLRADLHARAEVIEDFQKITFEQLEEWMNEQSERHTAN